MPSNNEKMKELFDEYKLAADQEQRIENNIWASSGIVGLENIVSLIAYTLSEPSINVIFIGSISIIFTWIWWNMAKRWWDIQHTIILRKRHIEQETSIKIQTYISMRDHNIGASEISVLEHTLGKGKFNELVDCDLNFHRRGVQKALIWLPRSVTIIWLLIMLYSIFTNGGRQMNISECLIIQILTYIGFIGLGFGIGVITGGSVVKSKLDKKHNSQG